MNLQKFIEQSLFEVMTGVRNAQDHLRKEGSHARICPTLSSAITPGGQQSIIGLSTKGQAIALVEYDIAVEVSNDGAGAEIKVGFGAVAAGLKGKVKDAERNAVRMKFSVPVAFPDIAD